MNSKLHFRCNKQKLVVVYSFTSVRLFVTPWTVARQSSLSFTISWSLLRFLSIELVMLSNHLILFCLLLLLSSIFPSIRVFSSKPSLRQNTGRSASASNFPMNIQGWFPLGLTGLISLQSKDSNPLRFCFKTLLLSKYQSVPRKRDQWTSRNLAYEFHPLVSGTFIHCLPSGAT